MAAIRCVTHHLAHYGAVASGYAIDATLDLAFRSGAINRYVAVPSTIVQGLIAAASKSVYFNRHIRNQFRSQRLA